MHSDQETDSDAPSLDIDQFRRENDLSDFDEDLNHAQDDGAVPLTKFGIDDELEEGTFDAVGNYRPNDADTDVSADRSDPWWDEINSGDQVKRKRGSRDEIVFQIKKRNKLEEAQDSFTLEEALLKLYFLTNDGQTVVQSIAQLNNIRKKSRDSLSQQLLVNAINLATKVITVIQDKGFSDVFEWNRDKLIKILEDEVMAKIEHYNAKRWCFKWLHKPTRIHSSYTDYEMQHWKENYFKNRVAVRLESDGDKAQNWLHISSLTFM